MIIRIFIIIILLLSILNIVGQTADNAHTAITKVTATANRVQTPPVSLFPIIEIISASTVLLLSRRYINRQLNKIQTPTPKPRNKARHLGGYIPNSFRTL